MPLVKLTRGNQLTIPKEIIQEAHLNPKEDYLSVEYLKGVILLKPVDIEERIPPEAYEKLLKYAFTLEEGDEIAESSEAAENILKKRLKKHRGK